MYLLVRSSLTWTRDMKMLCLSAAGFQDLEWSMHKHSVEHFIQET